VNFGVARGIGSAVFAVSSFLIGKLAAMLGSNCIPAISTVLSALFLASVLLMPEISAPAGTESEGSSHEDTGKGKSMQLTDFLKKYPVFISMAAGLSLLLIFHNMLNTFFIRLIESVGGDSRSLYELDAEMAARVYTAPSLVL
jgi:PPP family 3-phenylpropionic acid transporter